MITVTTGYAADQKFSIPDDEAHKAYFLFLNPDARTVFSNGIAVRGQDVQSISPDYHGTMGWHPTHRLDSDDFEELRRRGVDRQIADVLSKAKEVAMMATENRALLEMKLGNVNLDSPSIKTGYAPKTIEN